MNNEQDLRQLTRRTLFAVHQDGLLELFFGLWFTLLGSVLLVSDNLRQPLGVVGFGLLITLFPLLIGPGLHRLKSEITYPRVGYVQARPDTPLFGKLAMGLLALIVVLPLLALAAAISGLFAIEQVFGIVPALTGLVLALLFGALALRTGAGRYWLVSSLLLLAGIAVTALALPLSVSIALGVMVTGVVILLSGAIALAVFVARNPVQETHDATG